MGYAADGFITNVKELQRKKYPHETEYPHKTHYICKKDKEQKQLEVAIRDLRNQLQDEEKRTEVETKYKNLQKIH